MDQFRYFIRDSKGEKKTGFIEATDAMAASRILHDRGFLVIKIEPREEELIGANFLAKMRKVNLGVLSNFTRQLSTMIVSGLTLTDALTLLEKQAPNYNLKMAIRDALSDIRGGSTFSTALGKHPKIFSTLYISMVKAGEESGNLDQVLLKLANTLEKQREFEAKVKGAMIYPVIVVVVMIIVAFVVMIFVMPRLASLFENLPGVELPLPTKILLFIANFTSKFWWLLALILFGAVSVFRYMRGIPRFKAIMDRYTLKIPIFGELNKNQSLAYFTRTLAVLIGAGVPILQSLRVGADVTSNSLHRDGIIKAASLVEKGVPLSVPLSVDPNFPPLVSQMITVGEETGKMDEVLSRLADYFEFEVENLVKNLTSAIEPIMLLVVGAAAFFLILAIMLPILKLTSSIA